MDLSQPRVGWIGLGSMGEAMATNIQKHLSSSVPKRDPLRIFNRTASRGLLLGFLGATSRESVSELTRDSDIIFLSLSNDEASTSVIEEIISSGAAAQKIVVDTTTIHPDTTKLSAERLNEVEASLVAAPVFGATPVAQAGQLLMTVSGPKTAIEAIKPLLKGVIARDVMFVSTEPEKAMLLKTLGNFMTAGIMEIVAEGHVFAEKTGLGSEILEKLIEHNFGTLAFSDSRRMTTGVYIPGTGQAPYSSLDLALKDVGHGISCAKKAQTRLPVGELVLEHLRKAKAYSEGCGSRSLDSSSMYGVLREEAGLDFRTDFVRKRDGELGK